MRGTSPTPSPMLAAYRGRLNNSTAGSKFVLLSFVVLLCLMGIRVLGALDGSFLNQLSTPADSDGDEE